MWISTFHRFDGRPAFLAACEAAGWELEAEAPSLPAGVVVEEIGTLISPASIGEGGMPIAGAVLDPRHHVNLAWHARDMDPAFAASQVFPAEPSRAYALPPAAPSEPAVPAVVAAWKGKAVLAAMGLLEAAEAAVAAAGGVTAIAWRDAAEWERGSEMLATMAAVLGLSADQVDELFRQASAIKG